MTWLSVLSRDVCDSVDGLIVLLIEDWSKEHEFLYSLQHACQILQSHCCGVVIVRPVKIIGEFSGAALQRVEQTDTQRAEECGGRVRPAAEGSQRVQRLE